MKINSINQNQSFGRLKITATKKGEEARELYAGNTPVSIFDKIDKLSGNTAVIIIFDGYKPRKASKSEVYVSCTSRNNIEDNIGRFLVYSEPINNQKDFRKTLNLIIKKLNKKNTAEKYYA